jgi:hypothetical protein
MYPSDTTIQVVGLEEKLAMCRIVKPQSAADMGNVALTDDLFEGIHELLFSAPPKSSPKWRTSKWRFQTIESRIENARAVKNPILSSLKPVKL